MKDLGRVSQVGSGEATAKLCNILAWRTNGGDPTKTGMDADLRLTAFFEKTGKMISEFEQLAEKVSRLAELTQTLRQENAALRRTAVDLASENKELRERVQEAYSKVEAILAQLPEDDGKDAA